jgi:hypothetical protein
VLSSHINERVNRVVLWINQKFLLLEEIEAVNGELDVVPPPPPPPPPDATLNGQDQGPIPVKAGGPLAKKVCH